MIIAYSFGAVIALKLAHALETKGRVGKVVLIDGSFELMKALAAQLLPLSHTDSDLHKMVLTMIIELAFPEKKAEMLEKAFAPNATEQSYIEFLKFAQSTRLYSDGFIHKMFLSILSRIKILQKLNQTETAMPAFSATTVALIKPSVPTVQNMNEFLGMRGLTPSKIDTVEGNHSTILDNPQLAEALKNA